MDENITFPSGFFIVSDNQCLAILIDAGKKTLCEDATRCNRKISAACTVRKGKVQAAVSNAKNQYRSGGRGGFLKSCAPVENRGVRIHSPSIR